MRVLSAVERFEILGLGHILAIHHNPDHVQVVTLETIVLNGNDQEESS